MEWPLCAIGISSRSERSPRSCSESLIRTICLDVSSYGFRPVSLIDDSGVQKNKSGLWQRHCECRVCALFCSTQGPPLVSGSRSASTSCDVALGQWNSAAFGDVLRANGKCPDGSHMPTLMWVRFLACAACGWQGLRRQGSSSSMSDFRHLPVSMCICSLPACWAVVQGASWQEPAAPSREPPSVKDLWDRVNEGETCMMELTNMVSAVSREISALRQEQGSSTQLLRAEQAGRSNTLEQVSERLRVAEESILGMQVAAAKGSPK